MQGGTTASTMCSTNCSIGRECSVTHIRSPSRRIRLHSPESPTSRRRPAASCISSACWPHAIRESRLQPVELTAPAQARIANVFQVCASLAAGGYIVGDAVCRSVSHARAACDFRSALRDTYRRFGAGVVRQTIPAGWPTSAKDDGIDVIAWRHHPDRMPGKLYLLGQCASGRNWREKSAVDRIPQFHGWFSTPPATHWLPSMFIPFTLHRDLADDPTTTFDTMLANRHLRDEQRYGIVFDRFRIAHFADACLGSAADESADVDGRDRFSDVEKWVESLLEIPEFMESA